MLWDPFHELRMFLQSIIDDSNCANPRVHEIASSDHLHGTLRDAMLGDKGLELGCVDQASYETANYDSNPAE